MGYFNEIKIEINGLKEYKAIVGSIGMAAMSLTIDDEWENFLSPGYDDDDPGGDDVSSMGQNEEIVSEMGLMEVPKAT